MKLGRLLGGAGVLTAGVLAGASVARHRFERTNARLRQRLLGATDERFERTVDRSEFEGLPLPVRRYFETVLPDGQPYVRIARIEQSGELRLGDADSSWKSFSAIQHVTTDPPGFVWDADVEFLPHIGVRVVDSYVDGHGRLSARLLSVIPVADAGPSPELDEGELLRYLAEAVWYPTALLPSAGVEWEAIDATAAEATLEHGGTSVSLVFHFDEDGLVERVSTDDRPRAVDDGFEPTPWTGRFGNYAEYGEMLVPREGVVAWEPPEGAITVWRGEIEAIDYALAGRRANPRNNHSGQFPA